MVEKHVYVIPTITQAPPGNIWPKHHLYPVLIFLQAPLSMIPALRLFFPHVLVFTWSPILLVFQKKWAMPNSMIFENHVPHLN